ncbi:tripartite tricarboxylate transporter TctB family protein [Paracoccus laeviglucosivorans]|uniref:Tripartite tricarboxylate transporter TctB family protein n=1 Tax=Paracoccus laeviglucosivorans TaxID=1197861 RepID=A0A521EQA1_9RHOB|nr:tripartite tricarboxylate transporter TctB family protein [Paracoccus laeviglucosivorans]SMO85290.1 Tripartite tricarboxylate transporter TctB family protein [Paracoccus laeviglucosivorans]
MSGPGASKKGDLPDLLTAAIFIGFGALGLWLSRNLDGGTLSQMGAGYLPRAVSIILIVLGAAIGLKATRSASQPIEGLKLRPLLIITLSVIGFAYLAEHAGFVLASFWLVVAGTLADPGSRLRTTLLLAAGLTAFGALVFVKGLGVQIDLWPF